MSTAPQPPALDKVVLGWREWVALPQAGVPWVKAKIDTGARSSSMHAFDLEAHERDGQQRVRFSIHPWQRSDDDLVELDLPVLDRREVRSSNGQAEQRYAVALDVTLAGRTITTEMTLSNRDEMGFRMLIGREALARGFLVDASVSYAGGRPRRSVRRKNWGR
ncbi:RimK/LysX family protein [Nocardioides sp. zg-1228]|uniref:ATP-dependent zinc protease family protein n=1 Tax=Nocardioides sp. zg-1228 TaxID=2763008 RepID=UPI0016433E4C|nr:RimK/LysX family protein [Nocardioides sp. zg-1228]MBC2932038.1 ATP-dependent zinc protease [Nocardioides sp. zg-1228]